MEQKIRNICQKRLTIESFPKKSNMLMLGPDFEETTYLLLTFYKALSSSLESLIQSKSKIHQNDMFFHISLNPTLEIITAGDPIISSFRSKHSSESIFSYYKKKLLNKRLSDRIENNLPSSLKPNLLIIVLNGNRVIYDLQKYQKLIAEFKSKGIFYPHAIITRSEHVINKEITIEQVCFGLGISRSCVHFSRVYDEENWQNSIDIDLNALQILTDILQ
jgi:hypothetical protein